VREGGGFWGLDGWRVGGEVGEGGGRALFGWLWVRGVVWGGGRIGGIGGTLAGEEGEGERWGWGGEGGGSRWGFFGNVRGRVGAG